MACVLMVSVLMVLWSSIVTGHMNLSGLTERFLVDDNTVTVSIDSHHSIHTVSDKFVSVTLDTGNMKNHMEHLHANLTTVQNLAKGLSPAYLRFGGTSADHLSFKSGPSTDTIMSEHDFDVLCEFAKTVGWEMIFDLNLLQRKDGKWDPTNAESLLRYAAGKGYFMHLELGNEPNMFERDNIHVDPVQIGHDYGTLRHLMNTIPPFNHRMLVGPALTGYFHEDYGKKIMSTGAQYMDVFTVHQYYLDGHTAKQPNFLDPTILTRLETTIGRAQDTIKASAHGPQVIWMAETSSAYGGGAAVLSDSFISGFLYDIWLDKLGMAAKHGIQMVARQSFVGGRYSLVENDTPLPDYWLTLLYKRLVGKKVLKVTSSEHNNHFRIYAHCSANSTHPKGVTFYFQNMYDSDVKLNIPQYASHYYFLYILTAGDNGSITSKNVKLNGHDLHMNGRYLPHIEPTTIRTWPVKVPKHSFGFLVSPNADAAACS